MCKLGKSASETLSALQQVYGNTAQNKSAFYGWFSRLKILQETLEDDQCSGGLQHPKPKKLMKKCDI
jgi:hypothetical protein